MQNLKSLALAVLVGSFAGATLRTAAEVADSKSITAGVEVGTLGPGLSVGWRLSEHFGVRGGVNYFSYNDDGNEVSDINYNTKLRMFSAPLGVDFYPWADSAFRITGGVLFNGNRFTAVAPQQAPGAVSVPLGTSGGIDSAAIGDLRMKVDQNTIAPYIGVGYNWALGKEKRWTIGGEVGVAFAGSPEVTLTRSNGPDAIDAQVAIEQQQLEDDLDKYTVYPIIKVSVGFSF